MAKLDKQQQIQDLLKMAEDGARAVFESKNYRNYLTTMSKFHDYSFRNTLLIYMQKPESTYVAGYVAWKKNFNRQVQKGEKGIQIVGYTPKNVNQEEEKKDNFGNPIIGANGKPETEIVTRKIPYFTPVYVYDVSQTEGEPLPRLVNELNGSVEAYNDLMTALHEVSPFPIVFEDIKGGANGYCSPLEQKIAVRQGMSEAQTIKTTIHEITHADLHAPEIDIALEEKKDRRTKEIEAESTAFIVCNHYGIDTSDYSFGYLASWSSTKELSELQSSLETIQKQANELIDRIDNRLSELQKDRPIEIEKNTVPDKTVTIEERATDLAARYDSLVTETTVEKVFPFSIENQTERKELITTRIQNLDISSIDFIVDKAIENAPNNLNKEALIREFSQLKKDYTIYTTDVLKNRLLNYNNEPIVTVRWSENPAFKGGETYPLHEANKIFRDLDAKYPANMGYEKTAFTLIYEKNKEISNYEGRQDFGDREGGIIDHIKNFWQSELSPNMLSQHLAAGNTDIINDAKEAVNDFVPFLEAHNTLGLLADETRAQLGNLQLMKEQSATMPDLDKRIEYGQALLSYVDEARIALNAGAEALTMPKREDYISSPIVGKEAAEIETYTEEVRKEFTAEAAALGISVDVYAQNDFTAPAERSFSIYQLNATGKKYLFESLEVFGNDEKPTLSMYDKVYDGTLPPTATLDSIFEQFNVERPADFTGHSLSVSDLIVIEYDGEITANYIDKYGFINVPEIVTEIKSLQEEKNIIQNDPEKKPVLEQGDIFEFEDKTWKVEKNDGFILSAKNMDITDKNASIMWIGGAEKHDYKLISSNKSESTKEITDHRANEILDSIKFDNDIDLDKEKTREQLGFKENVPEQSKSAADIFKAAREKAAIINGNKDLQLQAEPQRKEHTTERDK